MRWQWRDMVRNLDWEAMESMARRDPNQQLCDTVHELCLGLENKPDVRKAKRILYFLKQAGFEPSPEETHEHPFKQPNCYRYGFIGTTASDGFAETGVVLYEDGLVKTLIASIHIAAGCMQLRAEDFPRFRVGDVRYQLLRQEREERYIVEAPPDYCLDHIRLCMTVCKSVEKTRGLKPWIALMEGGRPPDQHPSDEDGANPAAPEVCRSAWKSDPKSAAWKFWLHRDRHPNLVRALRALPKSSTVQERLEVLDAHRHEWLDQRCLLDGVMRFMDHSWALRQQNKPDQARAFLQVGKAIWKQNTECPFWDSWAEAAAETILEDEEETLTDTQHRLFAKSVA